MGRNRWSWVGRLAASVCFVVMAASLLASTSRVALASVPGEINHSPATEQPGFLYQVFLNLFNSRGLMETLGQPEYTIAAFLVLNAIVFTETGLLIGFFLPGDSLLVTAGLIAASPAGGWNLPLLLITLSLSAIIGDSIGYSIGYKAGPSIFCREKSLFFHKDHLIKAQEFYEKYGGVTIILARFMPILRTFAPVVAGVGRMNYPRFLFYNTFGGLGWVFSMVLLGYFLPTAINPLVQPLFGPEFAVQDHVEKVIVLIVLVSIAPMVIVGLRKWLTSSRVPASNPTPAVAKFE